MTNKKLLVGLFFSVLLAGCGAKKTDDPSANVEQRQLINVQAIKDRPYVAIFPHATNKLITMLFDKKGDIKNISTEIEYLSGNALKGARSSINSSTFPYSQAFLLGSCSAGGKCSFDTEITTGTLKTKFELGSEIHVLKSNYVFIGKEIQSTSDLKLTFKPEGKLKNNLVLSGNHGYIGDINGEVAVEPASILSSGPDVIKGTLSIAASNVSKAWVYDGSGYKETPFKTENGMVVIAVNQKPIEKKVMIIRDDLKGATEEAPLYSYGPVVLTK
jgi:hypothetical protein